MEIAEILAELRAERARFDKAIKALEELQPARREGGRMTGRKRKTRSMRSGSVKCVVTPSQHLAQVIPIRSFGS